MLYKCRHNFEDSNVLYIGIQYSKKEFISKEFISNHSQVNMEIINSDLVLELGKPSTKIIADDAT